jgi:hypothetical protein
VSHLGKKLRFIAFSASRHRATGFTDRLFLAHFAIITIGLVASVGNWNDSFTRFSIACGLSATMCVLCFGIDSPFIRSTLALWRGDLFLFIAPAREGSVSHETLDYIRHANLLAGAPPVQLNTIDTHSRETCHGECRRQVSFAFPTPNPFLPGGFHVFNRFFKTI